MSGSVFAGKDGAVGFPTHCNVADPEILEKFSIFPVFSTIFPDRSFCQQPPAFLQTCLEKLAKVACFSVKINNFQSFIRFFHIGGSLAHGIFQIFPARNSASQVFFQPFSIFSNKSCFPGREMTNPRTSFSPICCGP